MPASDLVTPPPISPLLYRAVHFDIPAGERQEMASWWSWVCFVLVACQDGSIQVDGPGGETVTVRPGEAALVDPESRVWGLGGCRGTLLFADLVRRPVRISGDDGAMRDRTAIAIKPPDRPGPTWYEIFGQRNPIRLRGGIGARTRDLVLRLAPRFMRDGRSWLEGNLELGAWIWECYRHLREAGRSGGNDLVERVDAILYEEMRQGIRLAEVARRLGYSARHLGRLYRQRTGRSLSEHYQHLREERARHDLELLRLRSSAPNRGLAHIARRIGFRSDQAFCRWFKLRTGTTPMAWVRQRA